MARIFILGNGQSIHTVRWLVHLAKEHEVTLLTFEGNNIPGISTIVFKGRKFGLIRYLIALPQLWFLLIIRKPHLIHAFYAGGYGLLGAFTFYRNYFLSVWGSDVYLFPKGNFLKKLILKVILSRPKLVFATSNDLSGQANKIYKRNYLIIPFGVDCDLYKNTKVDVAINQSKIIIGTVKSLEYVYGIDRLLNAFAIAVNTMPNHLIELVIVGDGKERINLINLASKLGIIDKVKFLGRLPQDQVPALLNQIDIFVALSRSESFGVAVLEASACSIPVIVSSIGGFPEVVIDKVTGFIVKDGDPQLAANKLLELILDPQLRKIMGENGRSFVEREYEWKNSLENFDVFITEYAGINESKYT
jgi:glycosyltransferase involved in cell wall biosynthesis